MTYQVEIERITVNREFVEVKAESWDEAVGMIYKGQDRPLVTVDSWVQDVKILAKQVWDDE